MEYNRSDNDSARICGLKKRRAKLAASFEKEESGTLVQQQNMSAADRV